MTEEVDVTEGYFTVWIGGKAFGVKTQTDRDRAEFWQATLKEAYLGKKPLTCGCLGNGAKQLSIHSRKQGNELYWLARYPATGSQHHPDCRFYSEDPAQSGLQGYVGSVVAETQEGLSISLSFGLMAQEKGDSGVSGTEVVRGLARPRQRVMTLLGVLHLLWTQARVNVWHPNMEGKRFWATVAYRIGKVAESIKCGGRELNNHLLIGKARADTAATSRNKTLVADAEKGGLRLVVLSLLGPWNRAMKDGKPSWALPLLYWDNGIPPLKMSSDMWRNLERSFPNSWAAWKQGGKVAVIAHVELTKSVSGKPGWEVLDVAIQAVTSEFIPVESSHEEEVAVLLAKEKRLFEKPLRYDASKMDVFPDFILLDCLRERYPMEVFGRSDEAYEDREADKRAYYQEHFGGDWWCWKVASGGGPPALPATKSDSKS